MYAIQNGREYIAAINVVTGTCYWTADKMYAKLWRCEEMAAQFADGIGRVVAANWYSNNVR